MTFDELAKLAVKVKDKKGVAKAKSAIQKYAPKLQNVAESDYDKLADELREILSPSKVEKEEKVLTYKDIREQALAVKRTHGVAVLLECIKKVCGEDATSMGQIMESQYEEFMRVTKDRLTVHGVGIKHYMPGDEIKTLHHETDTAPAQVEALAVNHRGKQMTAYSIGLPGDLAGSTTVLVVDTANLMGQKLMKSQLRYGDNWKTRTDQWGGIDMRHQAFHHMLKGDPIDVANYMAFLQHHKEASRPQSREEAAAWVKMLQQEFDLIDDVQVAETLMGKMEERHGEEFNAFFEASVRQVMLAAGLQQVKINTSDILLTLATGTQMRVREEPGFLIYEMVEDNDA